MKYALVNYEYRLIWMVKDETTRHCEEERTFTTSDLDSLFDQIGIVISKPKQRQLKRILRCNFDNLIIEEMKIELINNVLTLKVVE